MSKIEFWPKDTDHKVYVQMYDPTIQEIIDYAKHKFGDEVDMDLVTLTVEKIHTHCIHYDLYDPIDWTEFYVFENTTPVSA